MNVSDEIRDAARSISYGKIVLVDPAQAVVQGGRRFVSEKAVVGHYYVAAGEVIGFSPNTGYRMVIRP